MIDFKIKGIYNFEVYPTTISTEFKNVTILSHMTYDIANNYGDLVALHMQYYPFLPSGTPDDPTLYEYLLVRLESGDDTIIAVPWINANTVEEVSSTPIQVVFENLKPNEVIILRDVLSINGFTNYTIRNLTTGNII